MKIAFAFGVALIALGALIGAYIGGVAVGRKRGYDRALADTGLTRRTKDMFIRARQIIVRLDQTTDLDGLLAGDSLSPQTKRLVTDWVTMYRNEVSKV